MNNSLPNQTNGDITLFQQLRRLFNLTSDTDRIGTINLIKSNVEFQSANAWTLVFAIFIASVGLNINSSAVIIGAMLISPLMGPIVGTGLALGTYDFVLLKKSSKNLASAILISIVASTLYFLISPLSEVQSELLARTRPSFFDVLIAFFGGAAGIVAISRREKGNVIPGVAIATALMPPLCTAGFGLANRNFEYFFGAMYLFIINSVFISISTFIFVRYLGFHKSVETNAIQKKIINRWIASVAIVVLVPSFVMAWYLQKESFFRSQAQKYIQHEIKPGNALVINTDISYRIQNPRISVTLLGDPLSDEELATLKEKASQYSIPPSAIEIQQSTLTENIERRIDEKFSTSENRSSEVDIKLKKLESELSSFKNLSNLSTQTASELIILFPKLRTLFINKQVSKNNPDHFEMIVMVQWNALPSKSELAKSSAFLSKRLEVKEKNIVHFKSL